MHQHTRRFYLDALSRRLDPARVHHSLAVEKQAIKLAAHHGLDWYRAGLAGLVHDICRCDDTDWMLAYMNRHGVRLDRDWMENPQIWHGPCGSLFLRQMFGLRDKEILWAVKYHTSFRAGMTPLEKVICIADATSEDRTFEGADKLRGLALESLDEAAWVCLGDALARVAKNGWPLVNETYEAYNELARLFATEPDRRSNHI